MPFYINIGNTWKTLYSANVNVGGVWKQITDIKVNVGNTWWHAWPQRPEIGTGLFHTTFVGYGRTWGWGYNASGPVGDNTSVDKCTPVSIMGNRKTFCKISAANQFSVGIENTGKVWTWGQNTNGQLGINATSVRSTPVSILGGNKTFCKITTGSDYVGAIDKNGRVWTWGKNDVGQLGINSVVCKSTPVSILGANKTFCDISSGLASSHFSSLDKNGRIWTWGRNEAGQLGVNSVVCKSTPVSILGANKTFCKISTGEIHTIAIDKNGRIWAWGNNLEGELGNNAVVNRSTPVSILGANKTFCEIGVGNKASFAIDNRGLIWSWGDNTSGRLGINSIINKSTPTSILGARKTFCKVAAGVYASYGVDVRGKLWAWGNSVNSGLLANGIKTICTCTPIAVNVL